MNKLSGLYADLSDRGVPVFSGHYGLSGGCDAAAVRVGDDFGVFLDVDRICTVVQETEAVSHEWAHIVTGATYAFDASPAVRAKAERRAAVAQIKKLLPFEELRGAIKNGYATIFELAEYFTVSEDTVSQAIQYYTGPCGLKF